MQGPSSSGSGNDPRLPRWWGSGGLLALGIVAVVATLVIVGMLRVGPARTASGVRPDAVTPTASPAVAVAQVSPTTAPTATETPTPTPTPPPPTPTVAVAAATPSKPATTAEQRAYLAAVQSVSQQLQPSLSDASQRSAEVKANARVALDPAWQTAVLADASQWRTTYAQEQSRVAPPGLEAANAKWVEALSYLYAAGADLERSIADVKAGNYVAALTQANAANAQTQQYSAAMDENSALLQQFVDAHR